MYELTFALIENGYGKRKISIIGGSKYLKNDGETVKLIKNEWFAGWLVRTKTLDECMADTKEQGMNLIYRIDSAAVVGNAPSDLF